MNDSIERIREDAEKHYADYWGCEGRRCDECGRCIDWDSCDEADPPSCSYCPNCGRKVVIE